MSAIASLVTLIETQNKLSNLSSLNISNADVEGYARKEAAVISLGGGTSGGLGGVTLSPVYNTVDPMLQAQTRRENSILSKNQIVHQFAQEVNVMFGSKGAQASFAHDLGRFTASIENITANPDLSKKTQAVNDAVAFAKNMVAVSKQINTLRGSTDYKLAEAVKQVNELVKGITHVNQQISRYYVETHQLTPGEPGYTDLINSSLSTTTTDVTTLENNRAELVHKLAGLIDINVSKAGGNKLNISLTGCGATLIQGNYNYQLDYTPSNAVAPGDVLSAVTYLGTDITQQLKTGQLGGLLKLRDGDLVNAQSEFDELTRVIRDTVNALHNQGAALNGTSTLTGTTSVPGLAGAPLDLIAPPLSGLGTVRIGVMNNQGTIIDYKDVALTDNMTVQSLITAVNNTTYTIGGAPTTPAVGGTISLAQLPTGALTLQSTDGNTIVIGGVGGVLPMMSLGGNYDPTTSLGFSHFFGLNNLFETGANLASSTAQIGIANDLAVRDDIRRNPTHLAVGSLSQDTVLSTLPGGALGNRKTDIAAAISKQLSSGQLQFLAAGDVPAIATDPQTYSNQLMAFLQSKANQYENDLKASKSIYDQFASLAADKTGVNVSDEFIKVYNIKNSQQLAAKALKLVLEMQQSLVNII